MDESLPLETISPRDGVADAFSWGALLVPQFWYLIHGVWLRALLFWALIIAGNTLFLAMGWQIGLQHIPQSIAWYVCWYGASVGLAFSARRKARAASWRYADDSLFALSERRWLVAGLAWVAFDVLRLTLGRGV